MGREEVKKESEKDNLVRSTQKLDERSGFPTVGVPRSDRGARGWLVKPWKTTKQEAGPHYTLRRTVTDKFYQETALKIVPVGTCCTVRECKGKVWSLVPQEQNEREKEVSPSTNLSCSDLESRQQKHDPLKWQGESLGEKRSWLFRVGEPWEKPYKIGSTHRF